MGWRTSTYEMSIRHLPYDENDEPMKVVELDVAIEYTLQAAEPDVGIMTEYGEPEGYYADVPFIGWSPFTPTDEYEEQMLEKLQDSILDNLDAYFED